MHGETMKLVIYYFAELHVSNVGRVRDKHENIGKRFGESVNFQKTPPTRTTH